MAGPGIFSQIPGECAVPRYFFNVLSETTHIDRDGEELPDRHAAWKEATVMAGQILKDMDGNYQPGQTWQLEVTDEFANPLFRIQVHGENSK
jgi:uncharacterized protein DUF6894